MPRRNLALILAIPALVLVGLTIRLTAPVPDKDYLLLKQIAEVLAKVDREYVRSLSDEERAEVIEHMIDGGLRRLDEHSEYMNLERSQQFNKDTEGKFSGIGVSIIADPVSNYLRIESLFPGNPAYEAGLAAGDLITQVDGKSTEGLRVDEVRKLIQGEPGTPVSLVIRRAGRNPTDETVVVVRGSVEVNPVSGVRRRPEKPIEWEFMLDPAAKIGYIRLSQFSANATLELVAALKQLHEQGAMSLILDLREDPGGLLPQAISVADLFLPGGRIVSTRSRSGTDQEFVAKPSPAGLGFAEVWPMVVLVNGHSASASEIVAAALQDHNRAIVIGERTFGKGSVQKLFTIPGPPEASLKLTAETYWRPNGKNIHRDPRTAKETDEWGVKPNPGFEVPLTDEDRQSWVRHMRERELVTGKPGIAPPKVPDPRAPKKDEKPFEDRALQKAVEYLKTKTAAHDKRPRPMDGFTGVEVM